MVWQVQTTGKVNRVETFNAAIQERFFILEEKYILNLSVVDSLGYYSTLNASENGITGLY